MSGNLHGPLRCGHHHINLEWVRFHDDYDGWVEDWRCFYCFPRLFPKETLSPRVLSPVHPHEIVIQRERGWVDFHPETYCHRCGQRNLKAWYTDNSLWNQVMGDYRGIVCPQCFTELYEEASAGNYGIWNLKLELQTDEPSEVAAQDGSADEYVVKISRSAERFGYIGYPGFDYYWIGYGPFEKTVYGLTQRSAYRRAVRARKRWLRRRELRDGTNKRWVP